MKKNSRLWLVMSLMFIALLSVGCGKNQAQDAAADMQPTVIEEEQGVEVFGIIKAAKTENVTLQFTVGIKEVFVKDGQRVTQGDALLHLDLTTVRNTLSQKRRELELALMELNSSHPDIAKLMSDLELAKKESERTGQDLVVKKDLLVTGAISQTEYTEYEESVERQAKSVTDIERSLTAAEQNMKKETYKCRARVQQLREEIDALEIQLSSYGLSEDDILTSHLEEAVVCDISGVVGDIVNPSMKLLTVMDISNLVVEANVPEEFIEDAKLGADVTIMPKAYSEKEYHGKVIRMSGMAIKKGGEAMVPIEISIDDADELLLPNFNVDATIMIEADN